MISYLIKSGLCLAILLAFYYLVLEREKMHQFNRFYLLGSILFSFIVPFAVIYIEVAPSVIEETTTWIAQKNSPVLSEASPVKKSLELTHYLFILYTFISSLLLIRFVKSLVDIVLKIKQNQIISYQKAKIVLVNDTILPHTFWKYIFVNKADFQQEKIEKELFTHELTHVTQKHSLDVLIVEVLQVVLWFNPFFYPLKKAIQLNHEFLADDKVIASHHDIPKYQYLLLDKATWKNKYYLASNLNYSLTKKRLLMMKTPNSKSTILWKKLAIVPLMGGLIFLFADRVEAQSKKKTPQVVEIQKEKRIGATASQMEEYEYGMKLSRKNNIWHNDTVQRMRYIYSLMSEQQKSTVKNVDEILPPPPPPIERLQGPLSSKKYEDLKDPKKYAVWIDGRAVGNKELNEYSRTDFVDYFGSFVHKNARSKRFPQEYQFHLHTQAYIDKIQKEHEEEAKRIPAPINVTAIKKKLAAPKEVKKPKPPKPVKIEVVKKEKLPPPPPPHENATEKQKAAYKKTLKEYEKKVKKEKRSLQKLEEQKKKQNEESIARLRKEYQKNVELSEIKKKKVKETLEEKEQQIEKLEKEYRKVIKLKKEQKETVVEELEEIEEKELPEVIEIKETRELVEEIEEQAELVEVREKLPEEVQVEVIERLASISSPEIREEQEVEDFEGDLKKLYKGLVKKKAIFYLNGKKITAKKIKKYFFDKHDKLDNIDITKGKIEIVKVTLKTK